MSKPGDGYGSEYHLQRYLRMRPDSLSSAVDAVVGGAVDAWLMDGPFWRASGSSYGAGEECRGLDFLPAKSDVRSDWASFWPMRGNTLNWDAVGRAHVHGAREWVLVEAKAHVREVFSSCGAKSDQSRSQIGAAMEGAKASLGIGSGSDWMNGHYQFCNRLAALDFLTRRGVSARLVFIYFCGEDASRYRAKVECPADERGWSAALGEMYRRVGWPGNSRLKDRVHDLFLPVLP